MNDPGPTDHYPTRGRETAEFPRQDPVVWPGSGGGPLGQDTLQGYERDGFVVSDALLTGPEVERLRAEVDRLGADPALLADDRTIAEHGLGSLRSIFEVHAVSPLFSRLVTDSRLVDTACQILGSDVYIHQSRVNLKPGFGAAGFYWHSDFETWHAEDGMPGMRALSFSIALTENLPFNGPLMIMPGSHQTFVGCEGDTPEDHFRVSLRKQEIGTPSREMLVGLAERFGIRQVTGPAGSATIFDSNCMHGSSDNITPHPRCNVFVVFNSTENRLARPYRTASQRPEFIAARDFTPVYRAGRAFSDD